MKANFYMWLYFLQVVLGDGAHMDPFSVVSANTNLPAGAVVPPLATAPVPMAKVKAEPSEALSAALANQISSRSLQPATGACLQVRLCMDFSSSATSGYLT